MSFNKILTERELDVARQVGHGRKNNEIGTNLGITAGTVKQHLNAIYKKLSCNRVQLAVIMAEINRKELEEYCEVVKVNEVSDQLVGPEDAGPKV